jgi:hypothetical protein
MTQKQHVDALNRIISGAAAKERYRLADIKSAALTKHGEPHALGVMDFGTALSQKIESMFPGTFTPEELEFTIPAACWGHDIGRSEDMDIVDGKPKDRHEIHGARIMNEFMVAEGVPAALRTPVNYGIVHHRANGVLGKNALDPSPQDPLDDIKRRTLAVTVLADKCVGDAERVRTADALFIKTLRTFRLAQWYFRNRANEDKKNDFANYAIKNAEIMVDPNDSGNDPRYRGAIILKLKLDVNVATLEDIFSVKWFRESYHCCGKSAQVLGFVFRIEANGETWFFDKKIDMWAKRSQLQVPHNP